MYGLLVRFGHMFDKGQKQSSTLSCDSSYSNYNSLGLLVAKIHVLFYVYHLSFP